MKEIFLIVHFIGLAMGLGTSIAMMFLGIAAAKMPAEDAKKFRTGSSVLLRMGQIGLVLLILSGGYLMTPYWKSLGTTPLLMAKLVLVLVLAALIITISSYSNKIKGGDERYGDKVTTLGRFTLITALVIVVLAVLIFH